MQPLRVAVIGVGRLGQAHARVFSEMPDVTLIGVFDPDVARAAEVAARCGTQSWPNPEALCVAADAVSIVTPTVAHAEMASIALTAKRSVFVEKPIAATLEEADAMIALARTHGVPIQVGHIERFNGAVQAIEGLDIAPGFIESHRLASFDPRGTDVSVVHDLMIHDIDLIRHLVRSDIVHIDATGVAVISDRIDIANARLRFASGCVANVTSSRISLKKMRKMRLFQRDAYISMDFLEGKSEIYRLLGEDETAPPGMVIPVNTGTGVSRRILCASPPTSARESLVLELESFVRAARGLTVPPVTGEDGREALRVSLEIVKIIEEHGR
ncbi:MAG: Gfo/Idh/MocA family oxidoreductase [candidate division Zixibacteria bacterium]|nr:Gfo/Idh/MocA family oxidoreductase [candidate division Zixibacteria bacterium]